LLQRLKRALHARGHSHCVVEPTEHWGIDGDAVEAAAFAWLAYRRHYLLPGNLTAVTGAHGPRILGAIYPG
jgi:anhydro-N-acetylmuramic acid kinase